MSACWYLIFLDPCDFYFRVLGLEQDISSRYGIPRHLAKYRDTANSPDKSR